MATLFNTKIKDTYQSLLKLEDNTILTTTTKNITDGLGNASPLYMSTTQVRIGSTSASAMYWDNTNSKMGIGTNAPSASLQVIGITDIARFGTLTNYWRFNSNYAADQSLEMVNQGGSGSQTYYNTKLLNETYQTKLLFGEYQNYLSFGKYDNHRMVSLFNNGNFVIGSSTDLNARLGVRGAGSTSATTSLLVQNSSANTLLQVLDNGLVYVGTGFTGLNFSGSNTQIFNDGGSGGTITFAMAGSTYFRVYQPKNAGSGITSGEINTITTPVDYGWSSGSASPNLLSLNPSINNTGTYSGGTFRGIYYNPTLTSLTGTNHIAIQTVTGDVLFGTTSGKATFGSGVAGTSFIEVKPGNGNGNNRISFNDFDGGTTTRGGFLELGTYGARLQFGQYNQFGLGCNVYPYTLSAISNTGEQSVIISSGSTALVGNASRLQVYGNTFIKGNGSTSATSSLLVQNSSATQLLQVRDDGALVVGTKASGLGLIQITTHPTNGSKVVMANEYGGSIITQLSTDSLYFGGQYIGGLTATGYLLLSAPYIAGNTISAASTGASFNFQVASNLYGGSASTPARGFLINGGLTLQSAGFVNAFELSPNFNFDSSNNRIVKGIYYNPTITTPNTNDKHYGIQTTSGGVYINTTTPNDAAALQVDSTTQGVLFPRMTTTQKNAIASPVGGLVVYDTTTNKLCCYNGTTWNDLF